jgi:hypothetical protein
LKDNKYGKNRNQRKSPHGKDGAPIGGSHGIAEHPQGQGNGKTAGPVQVKEGPQKIIPAPVKAKNRGGDDRRFYQGKDDPRKDREFIAAVYHGRLVKFRGDTLDKLNHQKDKKGLTAKLGYDEGQECIYPAYFLKNDKLRHHYYLIGQHEGEEHTAIPEPVPPEMDPGKPIRHKGRREYRPQGRKNRVKKGIAEKCGKGGSVVVPPAPQVIIKPEIPGNKRNRIKDLPGFLKGVCDHPQYGVEHKKPQDNYPAVKNDVI